MYIYKSQIPATLMLKMTPIKFPFLGVPYRLIFPALQFHTIPFIKYIISMNFLLCVDFFSLSKMKFEKDSLWCSDVSNSKFLSIN